MAKNSWLKAMDRIAQALPRKRTGPYRFVGDHGYVMVWRPKDPRSRKWGGYYFEHRLAVERRLGRKLRREEEVHHHNGVKTDNSDSNLIGPLTREEHAELHRKLGWGKPYGKKIDD